MRQQVLQALKMKYAALVQFFAMIIITWIDMMQHDLMSIGFRKVYW